MKRLPLALSCLAAAAALAASAHAGGDAVKFPEHFERGVKYATIERGALREDLFTSPEAIAAVKQGKELPSGTVITLGDYRDGTLFRYVVMEKRAGWGAEYPPEKRTGEWEFQAFNADRAVNRAENLDRCFSCHKAQAANDFVFTRSRMKDAD